MKYPPFSFMHKKWNGLIVNYGNSQHFHVVLWTAGGVMFKASIKKIHPLTESYYEGTHTQRHNNL